MSSFINKDALVAEIEKRLEKVGHSNPAAYMEHRHLLDFIDTLEVKEVEEEPYVMGKTGKFTTTTK